MKLLGQMKCFSVPGLLHSVGADSEEEEEEEEKKHQARGGRWVRGVAGGVEWVGLRGRRNWEAKRKRPEQNGTRIILVT